MAAADPVIIVGSGLAGYAVARELRKRDSNLPLMLVTADGGDAYYKPALSNAFAAGTDPDALVQQSAAANAGKLGLELLTHTRMLGVDAAGHRLRTDMGDLPYRALVLAHGAHANPLRPEGDGPLFRVNDLADYRRLRAALSGARRIAVIGAGLVGCEFANDFALGGLEVVCSDLTLQPLGRLLPPAAGEALRAALAEVGVDWRLGRAAVALESVRGGVRLRYGDGSSADVDLVLSAVGLVPEPTLTGVAELAVARGIRVDSRLRTAWPDVYAIGDCAQYPAGWLPFVAPILKAAGPLAANLLGEPVELALPPMPVKVKTRSLPVVVLPPAPGAVGEWRVEAESARDLAALYLGADGALLGFALLGSAGARQAELIERMTQEPA